MLASKYFNLYSFFLSHKYLLRNNILAVIIDNTNIRMDECRPYFQKASTYGYIVIVIEPRTNWKRDTDILAS